MRLLKATLIPAALITPVQGAQDVTLAWDPSPESGVTNYTVYYGSACRDYTSSVSVGTATQASITGLNEGMTYYFAVTAANDLGFESDFSEEISYAVPKPVSKLQIHVTPTRQIFLTVMGEVGRPYDIQATETWTNWTVIGTVVVGASGSAVFTDSEPANKEYRWYRARQAQLPESSPRLQIQVDPARQAILSLTGQPDRTYDILATESWTSWTVIGTVVAGDDGAAVFRDPNAASSQMRYYRARQTR